MRVAFRTFSAFEAPLRRQVEAFEAAHPGTQVELYDFDFPALHALMVDGDGLLGGEWDAFLCASDWLPTLIADGKLLCIDPLLEAAPPQDWREGWSETLLTLQQDETGALYGMPYHDGPEMLLYRADLFEDEAERARFAAEHGRELTVPETWSEFLEVARFFTRPDEDLAGCVLAAKPDGHNNVYDFLIHLYSRGGRFLDDGRVAFAGPEGREAMQYLAGLVADGLTQPEPRREDSLGSGEVYAAGRAAMMWNWCGFAAMAELPESAVRGKTKLAIIPKGDGPGGRHVSLSAYWVMTIPRGAREPAASWELLRFIASPEMDRITALEGAIGCRRSTWRDPELRERFACYALIEEAHRYAETVPAIPEYDAINAVLNDAIDSVYTETAGVDDALERAAREVEAVLTG